MWCEWSRLDMRVMSQKYQDLVNVEVLGVGVQYSKVFRRFFRFLVWEFKIGGKNEVEVYEGKYGV